jgi:hypothetical protein
MIHDNIRCRYRFQSMAYMARLAATLLAALASAASWFGSRVLARGTVTRTAVGNRQAVQLLQAISDVIEAFLQIQYQRHGGAHPTLNHPSQIGPFTGQIIQLLSR